MFWVCVPIYKSPFVNPYIADCSKAMEPTEGIPSVQDTTSSSSTAAADVPPITTASQQSTSSDADSRNVLTTAPSSHGTYVTKLL